MTYVDGFVAAVPANGREAFLAHAREMDNYFKKMGATRVVECWGDDVPEGKVTDFRRAVKAEANETVVFSWVEWPSKDVRNKAMEAMQNDTSMQNAEMPFDGKRMIFGGFEMIFEL